MIPEQEDTRTGIGTGSPSFPDMLSENHLFPDAGYWNTINTGQGGWKISVGTGRVENTGRYRYSLVPVDYRWW
jgi:hypothetical protein